MIQLSIPQNPKESTDKLSEWIKVMKQPDLKKTIFRNNFLRHEQKQIEKCLSENLNSLKNYEILRTKPKDKYGLY